jgi:hypothetical protein
VPTRTVAVYVPGDKLVVNILIDNDIGLLLPERPISSHGGRVEPLGTPATTSWIRRSLNVSTSQMVLGIGPPVSASKATLEDETVRSPMFGRSVFDPESPPPPPPPPQAASSAEVTSTRASFCIVSPEVS